MKEKFKLLKNGLSMVFKKENTIPLSADFLLTAANIGLNLASPYLLSDAFSKLASKKNHEILGIEITPVQLAALFGITWGLSRLTLTIRKIAVNRVAARGVRYLLSDFTKHLMSLSLEYHATTPPTTFFEIENKCFQAFPDFSTEFLVNLFPTTIEVLLAVTILSSFYGADVGLSLLAVLSVYTFYNVLTAKKISAAQDACLQTGFQTHAAFDSVVKNYETVHCFNTNELELMRMDSKYAEFEKAILRKLRTPDKVALGQLLITGIGLTLLLVLMSYKVTNGELAIDDFALICFYLLLFSSPLANFGEAVNKARVALSDLETVFNFLAIEPEIVELHPNDHLNITQATANIEFKHVTFGYEGTPLMLDDASFTIPAGKKTAIVGVSGTGKTSIGKLLYRFYEPNSGRIEINQQEVREISVNSLRAAISLIPQKPVVFNDTIYNNVEYGGLALAAPGRPPREKVVAAIRAACMEDWISRLQQGMNTRIGEGGKKISGGQLQRLAIARAIMKESFIYIVDEATSSLDAATENQIQNNFDEISKGKTTLIITHRLTTVMNADKIIVLNEGKVAEEGTHSELLSLNGYYARAWHEQSKFFLEKSLPVNDLHEEEDVEEEKEQIEEPPALSLRKKSHEIKPSDSQLAPPPNLDSKEKGKATSESTTLFFAKPKRSSNDVKHLLEEDIEEGMSYGSIQREARQEEDEKKEKCSIM